MKFFEDIFRFMGEAVVDLFNIQVVFERLMAVAIGKNTSSEIKLTLRTVSCTENYLAATDGMVLNINPLLYHYPKNKVEFILSHEIIHVLQKMAGQKKLDRSDTKADYLYGLEADLLAARFWQVIQ